MKYTKLFNNHNEYTAFTASTSFITPNVSWCKLEEEAHLTPIEPPTPQHDFVEIGGVKWATMNVGANSITDTGLYFQWADTQGYTASQVGTNKQFTWNDYKYTNDGGSTMTKYNSTDGLTVLQASDDAAQANWGGNWRIPTTEEWQTLGSSVFLSWEGNYQGSGVAGLMLTYKLDSSKKIFLPAAGWCENGTLNNVGVGGFCWASSLYNNNVSKSYYISYYNSRQNWNYFDGRFYGYPIRAILDE